MRQAGEARLGWWVVGKARVRRSGLLTKIDFGSLGMEVVAGQRVLCWVDVGRAGPNGSIELAVQQEASVGAGNVGPHGNLEVSCHGILTRYGKFHEKYGVMGETYQSSPWRKIQMSGLSNVASVARTQVTT